MSERQRMREYDYFLGVKGCGGRILDLGKWPRILPTISTMKCGRVRVNGMDAAGTIEGSRIIRETIGVV